MRLNNDDDFSIFDTMQAFFVDDEWNYEHSEGDTHIRMGFRGKNGQWRCIAQAREEARQLVFYSVFDSFVPEDRRMIMADFITRANYGLLVGNFEMDFDDGEIRFKTSIDVEGTLHSLTSLIIRRLVYTNVLTVDRYFPGAMQLMFGSQEAPKELIARIEAEEEEA
jgi:hypothetical protein